MQFTIPTHSLLGHILGKPRKEQERIQRGRSEQQDMQRSHTRDLAHLTAIAGQYGYGPDSKELAWLTQSDSLKAQQLAATAFSHEADWHEIFDPRSSSHVEYRNGTLVVRRSPEGLAYHNNFGASCVDIVHARLAEGWEKTCDRIVIDSTETTFFDGDTAVVTFTNSGWNVQGGGLGKLGGAYNTADILHTLTEISISKKELSEDILFRTNRDIVVLRQDGVWRWQ